MKNQNSFAARITWTSILAFSCILVLSLGISHVVQAQDITAAVRGTVTDPQGGAIAGADVTVTSVETGFSRTVKTDADGVYNFPDLPLGSYKIRASHEGFKAGEQTGIVLHVADSRVINIALGVGQITEQVTVEANTIQVETTSGDLSGLIEGNQVTQLPLNGRNFMQLVTLVPGVAAGPQFSAQAKGLKGGSDLSISGGAVDANLWLVDGASNNDIGSNRTILIFPSVDAIDEFKVERNSYSAQFGQAAGGQISIVTKSGSNAFHGDVYYFGRNDKLDTFDTFVKRGCLSAGTACQKNKLRRNDFGYTIGGPIKKDKIFFFWSQEWNRMIEGETTTNRVPTAAEKAGDFSAIAACPNAVSQLGWTSTTPGGNTPVTLQIPQGAPANTFTAPNVLNPALLSPVAQVVLQSYPNPTDPNPCAANNFTKSFGVPTYWREENVRGEINLTKSLRAMMRFTNDSWQLGPPDGGFGWGNNNLGPIGQSWSQPGRVVVGKLSQTIGTSMVNDFTFSYSANRITITPAGTDPGLGQKINDALTTFFPASGKTFGDKGPTVWTNCCGLPSVWTIAPWQNQEDLYTWKDDFSKVMGRHTLRFGGLYSRNYKAEQSANAEWGNINGIVGYNGFKGTAASTLFGLADLELVNMGVGWGETANIFKVRNVWRDVEGYATDNWRITPRITLDYGVRWSYLGTPYLSDDRYTEFNPAAFDASLGAVACNGLLYSPGLSANPCPPGTGGVRGPTRSLVNQNYHNFAPRIGVAWDPTGTGKWALRAGGGQYFDRDRLWPLQLGPAGGDPPFNASFSSPNGNGRFLDSTNQLPACTPNCFASGLGSPQAGLETSNHLPNSWQWNVSAQHELFRDAKLELGYVGHKNLHWEANTDVNAVLPADRLTYVQNENSSAPGAGALLSSFRPFGAAVGNNGIKYYTHASSSDYQSLQSLFNMRFHGNSSVQVAYTYSKLLSNSQQIDSPAVNVDAYNIHSSWGPDLLNHTHLFSANVVYGLPALQGQNAWVRGIAGGWETSTIVSISSGDSVSTLLNGVQGLGDPAGVGGGGNSGAGQNRPDRVAGQSCRVSGMDSNAFINPNMFTVTGYQLGQVGNAGVGTCTGPPVRDVDFGLNKTFKITERIKAQFRFEFFNLFNHPIYDENNFNGNTTIGFNNIVYGDANGNVVTPNAQKVLVGATQILSATTSAGSNFGKSTAIRENGLRQIQYALKFTF